MIRRPGPYKSLCLPRSSIASDQETKAPFNKRTTSGCSYSGTSESVTKPLQHWLSTLLSIESSRILLNGTPGNVSAMPVGCGRVTPLLPFLFVIAMKAPNALFWLADSWGVHAPAIWYRLSLYADDLVIFVTPSEQDMCCVRAMLQAFAEASRICSNIPKSQFTPIQYTEELIQLVQLH
jgi:hypothetical protein